MAEYKGSKMFPPTANPDDYGVMGNDGRMWMYGHVRLSPPFSDGLYATDADKALKTLPRFIQRLIWSYAKWRMK
jgi:hypothetical protein